MWLRSNETRQRLIMAEIILTISYINQEITTRLSLCSNSVSTRPSHDESLKDTFIHCTDLRRIKYLLCLPQEEFRRKVFKRNWSCLFAHLWRSDGGGDGVTRAIVGNLLARGTSGCSKRESARESACGRRMAGAVAAATGGPLGPSPPICCAARARRRGPQHPPPAQPVIEGTPCTVDGRD